MHYSCLSSRSLFIWWPKDKCEPAEQKDEGKIIVCGKAEKKRGSGKFGDDSDDSDGDTFSSKGKNSKSKKSNFKSSKSTQKKFRH